MHKIIIIEEMVKQILKNKERLQEQVRNSDKNLSED